MARIFSVIYLLLIFPSLVFSQRDYFRFKHVGREQGLSNSEATIIVQDKEGFIWIGTIDGLNRYDGISCKIYRSLKDDSSSLSSNTITSLFVDNTGTLWVGTVDGLCKYNKYKDNFKRYYYKKNNPVSLFDNDVASITQTKDGTLWIATFWALNRYNAKEDNFTRYNYKGLRVITANGMETLRKKIPNSSLIQKLQSYINKDISFDALLDELSTRVQKDTVKKYSSTIYKATSLSLNENNLSFFHLRYLLPDDNGNLWIAYSSWNISCFHLSTGKFKHYINHFSKSKYEDFFISSMCFEGSKLWISTRDEGLWQFFPEKNYWLKFGNISDQLINKVICDSEGKIWFGGENTGLWIYEPYSGDIKSIKNDLVDKNTVSSNTINNIFEDRQKNIWICNKQGDVDIITRDNPFKAMTLSFSNEMGLSNNNVSSVMLDRDSILWVGYKNSAGIDMIDLKNKKRKSFEPDQNNPSKLGGGTVNCFYEDENGNIWIGTYLGGLQIYNKKSGQFRTYRHDANNPGSISGNNVKNIIKDKNGAIWMALSGGGVEKIDPVTMKFTHFRVNYSDTRKSISSDWNTCIFCDKENRIWVGSVFGVSIYDQSKATFRNFHRDVNDPNSLSSNMVLSIYQDSKGQIWVGTNKGLNLFNSRYGIFQQFTTENGLSNDFITAIIEDDQQNLWIATYSGLSVYSLNDRNFKTYSVKEGLASDEFVESIPFKSQSGYMFFGGSKGLNYFKPDQIIQNKIEPVIYLTNFKIFNKPVTAQTLKNNGDPILEKQIIYSDFIKLSYAQKFITFEFVALDYTFNSPKKYAYKLEGFDKNWIVIENKNDITYTNLSPGTYYLKIKTLGQHVKNEDQLTKLKLVISAPWWRSVYAYIIYFFIVAASVYLLRVSIRRREALKAKIEYEKLEANRQHELDQLKIQFFTNISHEFRTPLTLILGPLEKLKETCKDISQLTYIDVIHRNSKQLLRLINQLMDFRKMDAGRLELNLVKENLISVVQEVYGNFKHEAKVRGISFQIKTDFQELNLIIDPDKLEKVLNNLVSNAFKFVANNGIISIWVNKNENSVNIVVEDNGIGMEPERAEKIFQMFHQEKSDKLNLGTGIGLALAKQLVEMHKGTIKVETKPGEGARFIVSLPIVDNETAIIPKVKENTEIILENPDYSKKAQEEQISEENKPVLLIIEDNTDIRLCLKEEFSPYYIILEAANGNDGLNLANEELPDCIISDVMMPEMSGIELCNKLKSNEITNHIPIVLLTARSSEVHIIEGLNTGADDYVVKPFSFPVLFARVNNLVNSRAKLREKFLNDPNAKLSEIASSTFDDKFMQKLIQVVEQNLSDTDFDATAMAALLNLSRSQVYRKIKALTGQTVHEFIRTVRLKKAAELIKTTDMRVSEIAFNVGFNSIAYFTSSFSSYYGVPPTKYKG